METGKDQNRTHVNNLQATEARHGYGEIKYDSGSSYKGQWQNDRRWGVGKFRFTCGVRDGRLPLCPSARPVPPSPGAMRAARRPRFTGGSGSLHSYYF